MCRSSSRSGSDSHSDSGSGSEQHPLPSTRASGAHRGVPGSTLCLRCPLCCAPRSAQCPTGQPPRYTAPVHLLPPRSRPPACHRRGRSPLPSPPRDRADGATLGRPRHEPRRTRRPALRDAKASSSTNRPRVAWTTRGLGAWRCSVREAAWHRSHRLPRGAGPTHGTAPIASLEAWTQLPRFPVRPRRHEGLRVDHDVDQERQRPQPR